MKVGGALIDVRTPVGVGAWPTLSPIERQLARMTAIAVVLLLVGAFWAFGSGPPTPKLAVVAHLPRQVTVRHVAELRIRVTGGVPSDSLVRLDGVPGWHPIAFGPDGYYSRDFGDEDSPQMVHQSHGMLAWLTGSFATGDSIRLFLVPWRPGHYRIHLHLLVGKPATLQKTAAVAKGVETTLNVTVRPEN